MIPIKFETLKPPTLRACTEMAWGDTVLDDAVMSLHRAPPRPQGEMYPAGRRGPQRGKIPEADGGRLAAPDPGLRGRRGGVGAGFEPECGNLVLLVADA